MENAKEFDSSIIILATEDMIMIALSGKKPETWVRLAGSFTLRYLIQVFVRFTSPFRYYLNSLQLTYA